MQSTYIIAEAGINHNGRPELAFQLIDAAVASGADAVKFQTFKAENLVTRTANKAEYQQRTTASGESQYAMLKRLELDFQVHHQLKQYCNDKNIEFLSTAFDEESLAFIANDLELKTLKISSGEITNGPLLLAHARYQRNIILSTGMATIDEIEETLGVLAFGFIYGDTNQCAPSKSAFRKALSSIEGQRMLEEKVTLLHCTTEYPAPLDQINLCAMPHLAQEFHVPVGYSDHSEGILVAITAVAMGASVVEKHFTLDRGLPGPDHAASLEPSELTEMVSMIRNVEKIRGAADKQPTAMEMKNRVVARKSLVASQRIEVGKVIDEGDLAIKRPGTGVSPMRYWDIVGSKSHIEYAVDDQICVTTK